MSEIGKKRAAIAARLRLAREMAGLSQSQVAKMLNLHRPSVSESEAGRRGVSAEELARLAEIYGVSIAWLACVDAEEPDMTRDHLQLAARELGKLKPEDMDRLLKILSAIRLEKDADR